MIIPLLLMTAQAASPEQDEIVVTASRVPEERDQSAATATVIDARRIDRLGDPLVHSLVRLTPSAAVETGGPAGSLSQVRIRGAEANHTLLFIDGIRANDPAAGGIPRFELLNADLLSRVEVVRGPQSALWGSDAIGGVVAVDGLPVERSGHRAGVEAGSFGFGRASASASLASDRGGVSGAIGWQQATGIDSFDGDGDGDRDGYRNLAARLRGDWAPARGVEIGASAFTLAGRSQFDGFNPDPPFQQMDTLDSTRNRLSAGRLWVAGGDRGAGLSATVATSLLHSSNRNFLDREEINRTSGERWTAGGQLQYRFSAGGGDHSAILAFDHDSEGFRARDTVFFGASDQKRDRSHYAFTGEWRAEFPGLVADIAIRHDRFSAFGDATTLRASALAGIGRGFALAGSYSEGIAQPTFFDLYGFFPGSFAGNPALKPESSRGIEASLRYRRGAIAAALTGYRQRLHDEIVDLFDPQTFRSTAVNREDSSRRAGVEAELEWRFAPAARLTANYSYLRASEPSSASRLREIRRPSHSGSLALDGASGRYGYGASIAYVGARADTDFEVFPAQRVRLKPYWLASARIAYALRPGLEIFARGSNLLDERYQDVFGYRTEGRGLFAGLRVGSR